MLVKFKVFLKLEKYLWVLLVWGSIL